jgi:YVTN family beta-propeller protein
VPVGAVPRGILFNPQNNRVYCSNYSSDTVSVIDGVTNAVVATVAVGDGPTALGHNPVGNKVYVSNVGAPGPNTPPNCTISVIGAATNAVVTTIPAGDEPTAFCFSPADSRMYWVNEWSHSLAATDAATDVTALVLPLGTGNVQPVDIAYNSVNGLIYTANRLTYSIGVLPTLDDDCRADLDGNGSVGGSDLGVLLAAWGTAKADLTGDRQTDAADLAVLLASWGACR